MHDLEDEKRKFKELINIKTTLHVELESFEEWQKKGVKDGDEIEKKEKIVMSE